MLNQRRFSAPLSACISITKRCNLKCKHCCTGVDLEDHELTFREITDLLDQLKEAKVFTVQIMGGEALVRKDWFEILKAVKERKFKLGFNTNCTLVTDKVVSQFREIGLNGIATSLDGGNAKIHDALRGAGAFEKATAGMKRLIKAGVHVEAEAVVTKLNLMDLCNISATAKKLGLTGIRYVPIFYGGQAKCFKSDLAPDMADYKSGIEIAKELRRKHPHYAKGPFLDGYDKIEKFKSMKRKKGQRTANVGLCGAGRSAVAIRSDGMVLPCSAFWELSAGSIREKSFREIWEHSPVLEKFRKLDDHSLDSIPECSKCEYKYFCNGNCRAAAYYNTGSITGFCPDCEYFK